MFQLLEQPNDIKVTNALVVKRRDGGERTHFWRSCSGVQPKPVEVESTQMESELT